MRTSFITTLLIATAALYFACDRPASPPAPEANVSGQIQKVNILVEGMTCEGCASSIKTAVGALPGVEDCAVEFKTGNVVVAFDPTRVNQEQIYSAISSQGYKPVKNL